MVLHFDLLRVFLQRRDGERYRVFPAAEVQEALGLRGHFFGGERRPLLGRLELAVSLAVKLAGFLRTAARQLGIGLIEQQRVVLAAKLGGAGVGRDRRGVTLVEEVGEAEIGVITAARLLGGQFLENPFGRRQAAVGQLDLAQFVEHPNIARSLHERPFEMPAGFRVAATAVFEVGQEVELTPGGHSLFEGLAPQGDGFVDPALTFEPARGQIDDRRVAGSLTCQAFQQLAGLPVFAFDQGQAHRGTEERWRIAAQGQGPFDRAAGLLEEKRIFAVAVQAQGHADGQNVGVGKKGRGSADRLQLGEVLGLREPLARVETATHFEETGVVGSAHLNV